MLQNMNPNNHDNNAFSKAIIGPYITFMNIPRSMIFQPLSVE